MASASIRGCYLFVKVVFEKVSHRHTSMAVVYAKEVTVCLFRPLLQLIVKHDSQPVFVVVPDDAIVSAGSIGEDLTCIKGDYRWLQCSCG
jgi:hypothetical protein